MQIVDNDIRINFVKFEEDSLFVLEYLSDKVWFPGPLKLMVTSILFLFYAEGKIG